MPQFRKERPLKTEEDLNNRRKEDEYWYDHAKKWFLIIFTWCVTACLTMLALGFIVVYGKYILYLAYYNTCDPKTEEILGKLLDWTMKIIIGILAKSYFEKR